MTKTYGVKDKDVAASYLLDQLLSGALRTGDRIDRSEVAAALGMSRVPVSEAIVQLERDGIFYTRYYRGVFVERFDPEVVREHHEVYGELCAMASARAATNPTPRILTELKALLATMESAPTSEDFENAVWEFRRTINHEYGGPRLRAAIGTFQSFIPKAFWISYEGNQAMMMPYYRQEFGAIRAGDAAGAREACRGRSCQMAEIVIAELIDRGVFEAEEGR